jgi:hypothetical protein
MSRPGIEPGPPGTSRQLICWIFGTTTWAERLCYIQASKVHIYFSTYEKIKSAVETFTPCNQILFSRKSYVCPDLDFIFDSD